jgi:hypothetical protein
VKPSKAAKNAQKEAQKSIQRFQKRNLKRRKKEITDTTQNHQTLEQFSQGFFYAHKHHLSDALQ